MYKNSPINDTFQKQLYAIICDIENIDPTDFDRDYESLVLEWIFHHTAYQFGYKIRGNRRDHRRYRRRQIYFGKPDPPSLRGYRGQCVRRRSRRERLHHGGPPGGLCHGAAKKYSHPVNMGREQNTSWCHPISARRALLACRGQEPAISARGESNPSITLYARSADVLRPSPAGSSQPRLPSLMAGECATASAS